MYIYGRKTTVETDHLLLISISKKQLCVEGEDGRIMRRNRQHLMATREAIKSYRYEPAPQRDETQPTAMAAPATATETNDVDETNDVGETTEQTSPAKTPTAPRRSERVRTAPVRLGL